MIAIAGALVGFVPACAKNRETSAAPESAPVSDDIAAIEARLASNAAKLESQGVAIDGKSTAGAATDDDAEAPARDESLREERSAESVDAQASAKRSVRARPRCERICDLAASTCDLRARICDLAQVHEGELRYEDACERAAAQCDAATAACTRCR